MKRLTFACEEYFVDVPQLERPMECVALAVAVQAVPRVIICVNDVPGLTRDNVLTRCNNGCVPNGFPTFIITQRTFQVSNL